MRSVFGATAAEAPNDVPKPGTSETSAMSQQILSMKRKIAERWFQWERKYNRHLPEHIAAAPGSEMSEELESL